jgi:hypothetical protein
VCKEGQYLRETDGCAVTCTSFSSTMQAQVVEIIQLIRADPASVKRNGMAISYLITTHEDSDAFVLALTYAARNMTAEMLDSLDSCITRVTRYQNFSVHAHLRPIRARANFRAG